MRANTKDVKNIIKKQIMKAKTYTEKKEKKKIHIHRNQKYYKF
jgi:hypothetical protein